MIRPAVLVAVLFAWRALAGQVQVVEPEGWPEEVRRDVDAALRALPSALIEKLPGGELLLTWDPRPAPFAMIEDTEGPRFSIHPCGPVDERHPNIRMGLLRDPQRCSIWRRRAVVHAVMKRWNDSWQWSEAPAWRRINGWLHAFERPTVLQERALNTFEGAFSRNLGQQSAALDLITFAEELFIRPESLHPAALPLDDRAHCRERSKTRFLKETLEAAQLIDVGALGLSPCPAFEGWARAETLESVEVLFVAASGRAPESLFGHLLLQLVRGEDDEVSGPSFGTAIQLVALTGAEPPTPRYLWRGLTGGYQMAVLTTPTGDLFHQTLEHEQRSIRRFRLKLSATERARFLERVWDLERRGYFEYWFFTDNCATLLAFLVEGALDPGRHVDLPGPLTPVLPSAVVDALARAGVLEPVPGTFEFIRDRAVRAEDERDHALARIEAALTPDAREALARAMTRVRHPQLAVRRSGWQRLAALTRKIAPAASREVHDALLRLWVTTVRIERYEVERADAERRELLLKTLDTAQVRAPDADQTVASRQLEFEREDALLRRLAVLDRLAMSDEVLARAPRRPLTAAEEATLEHASALAEGFRDLTELQASFTLSGAQRSRRAAQSGAAFLKADEQQRIASEGQWMKAALTSSGYARFAAGAAFDASTGTPLVALHTAALNEELGDQRRHGFRASSQTQVLAGTLLLRPRWGVPEVARSDVTLFGYRTLQPEVRTFRNAPWDALGWGARLGWHRDAQGAERFERDVVCLEADVLATLDASPRFDRFAALGLGMFAQAGWGELQTGLPARVSVGPSVTALARLPLGSDLANALRLEVSYRPGFDVARAAWQHDLTAAASLDLRVPSWTQRGILVRPRVSGRMATSRVDVELLFEPLR